MRGQAPILKRPQVLNLVAVVAALVVVLQQTVVALAYLVQAAAVVGNRVAGLARTAGHGVGMALLAR